MSEKMMSKKKPAFPVSPQLDAYLRQYSRNIGIPIFCSIKNKHISLEHTHPPHTYIMSEDKFKIVSELKKEFSEIIH